MLRFGALETGGTKMVCAVGTAQGKILEQAAIPTRSPGKPHHGMLHPEGGHIFVERRADDPMVRGVCPYHPNCLEGLDHPEEYIVPASLGGSQGVMGAIKLAMDVYTERGGQQ